MALVIVRKKIHTIVLTLLCSFCFTQSFCQNNTDSLENTLQNKLSDSVRLITFIKLSEQKQYTDFVNAILYADKAFAIAEGKNWPWAKRLVYGQLAFLATISGDFSTAMKYDNLNHQMNLDALDSAAIAQTLNFLGNDYYELGKYDEAYYHFTQSYRMARALDDQKKMAIAIFNIGLVLTELGQYEMALNHYNFSRDISEKVGDLDGLVFVLEATGELYLKRNEYKKSEEYLVAALKAVRERNLTIIEPKTLKALARVKFKQLEYKKAFAYYDTALVQHKKAKNEFGVAKANLGKSEIYIEQQKFDEAQTLIEASLITAKKVNAEKMTIDCYKQLATVAEKMGDHEISLEYYKNYQQLEDSLFSTKMLEKIFQDQLRTQAEVKDTEIATLSKAKSEQESIMKRQELLRNVLIVVMVLFGILLLTMYRSRIRRIKINNMLLEHQNEMRKRSQELQQLNEVKDKFLSIVSHDLRSPINSLTAILDLADKKNLSVEEFNQLNVEVRKRLNQVSRLINNLLDWALLQMDNMKIQQVKIDLANLVDDNLKLLEAMPAKKIQCLNLVPSNTFGWADPNMINLVLRNLIFNGMKFSETGGTIEVSCKDHDPKFVAVAVKDYGVGISREAQKLLFAKTEGYTTRGTANEKGTGLGLILCKEFVEKNGGKIWFESEEGKGSTFCFTIQKPVEQV